MLPPLRHQMCNERRLGKDYVKMWQKRFLRREDDSIVRGNDAVKFIGGSITIWEEYFKQFAPIYCCAEMKSFLIRLKIKNYMEEEANELNGFYQGKKMMSAKTKSKNKKIRKKTKGKKPRNTRII